MVAMLYFAYGANLHAQAVADWCRQFGHRAPSLRNGAPAILDNYRMAFPIFSEYWGGGTADIVYDPGKYVAGAVFELAEAEMDVLDLKVRRQIDPSGRELGPYRRVDVELRPMGKGATMRAVTYQGTEQEAYHIPPTQAYLDLIVEGAFQHGLSVMWISYLKSFSAQPRRPGRE